MVQHHGTNTTEVVWHFHNVELRIILFFHPKNENCQRKISFSMNKDMFHVCLKGLENEKVK